MDGLAPWERALVDLLKANFAPDILDRFAKETDLSMIAHVAREELMETPRRKPQFSPIKVLRENEDPDKSSYNVDRELPDDPNERSKREYHSDLGDV